MERTVRSPAANCLSRLLPILLTLMGSSLFALGQTTQQTTIPTIPKRAPESSSTTTPTTQPGHSGIRPSADETFELNIAERRYSQETFEASTAVGTSGDGQKLNLHIGVALSAGRIDALLRNVHGTVRFRGSLGRILDVVGDRLTPSPATSPTPSP